jgi:hypothetical protein
MRIGPPEGETDQDRQAIRESTEYQEMRSEVLSRDAWHCRTCGWSPGGPIADPRLNVHHIRSFYSFPDLRLNPHNCIVLCERCHATIHGKEYNGVLDRDDPLAGQYQIGYRQGMAAGSVTATEEVNGLLLSHVLVFNKPELVVATLVSLLISKR